MGQDNEKASWNLSQLLIMEIGNLLSRSSDAYVSGNYSKAFENLKAVSMRVVSYLEQEEYEKLIDLESNMSMFVRGIKLRRPFEKRHEVSLIAEMKLQKKLDEYNKLIFFLLKKYGLLIPAKKDLTDLQA